MELERMILEHDCYLVGCKFGYQAGWVYYEFRLGFGDEALTCRAGLGYMHIVDFWYLFSRKTRFI